MACVFVVSGGCARGRPRLPSGAVPTNTLLRYARGERLQICITPQRANQERGARPKEAFVMPHTGGGCGRQWPPSLRSAQLPGVIPHPHLILSSTIFFRRAHTSSERNIPPPTPTLSNLSIARQGRQLKSLLCTSANGQSNRDTHHRRRRATSRKARDGAQDLGVRAHPVADPPLCVVRVLHLCSRQQLGSVLAGTCGAEGQLGGGSANARAASWMRRATCQQGPLVRTSRGAPRVGRVGVGWAPCQGSRATGCS